MELKRIIAESQKQDLTEIAIDAPRGFFMGLELGFKNLEDMRDHMDICGYDYSMWPDWAKVETGHITKAGKAIIVWSMMQHASPIIADKKEGMQLVPIEPTRKMLDAGLLAYTASISYKMYDAYRAMLNASKEW